MLLLLLIFCSLYKSVYVFSNTVLKKSFENCFACEEGWYAFGDKCYKLGGYGKEETKVSWQEASNICAEMGGKLASIHSKEQNDFFIFLFAHTLKVKPIGWIGLNDLDKESIFVWEDGSPVNYQNWFAGQPDDAGKNEHCGEFRSFLPDERPGTWNDYTCDVKQGYICQKDVILTAHTETDQKLKCPDFPHDWKDLGGEFCYFIETERKISWFEAQEECLKRGGTLATIQSEVEEKVLHLLVKPLSLVFIGLNSLLTNGDMYTWSDGSHLNYTHWQPNEPNGKHEMCVQILTQDMSWNDVPCITNAAFMCQVKKVSSCTTSEERTPNKSKRDITVSSPKTNEKRTSNESKAGKQLIPVPLPLRK